MNELVAELEERGCEIFIERQNSFKVESARTGAVVHSDASVLPDNEVKPLSTRSNHIQQYGPRPDNYEITYITHNQQPWADRSDKPCLVTYNRVARSMNARSSRHSHFSRLCMTCVTLHCSSTCSVSCKARDERGTVAPYVDQQPGNLLRCRTRRCKADRCRLSLRRSRSKAVVQLLRSILYGSRFRKALRCQAANGEP